eukprot:s2093_g8.t2
MSSVMRAAWSSMTFIDFYILLAEVTSTLALLLDKPLVQTDQNRRKRHSIFHRPAQNQAVDGSCTYVFDLFDSTVCQQISAKCQLHASKANSCAEPCAPCPLLPSEYGYQGGVVQGRDGCAELNGAASGSMSFHVVPQEGTMFLGLAMASKNMGQRPQDKPPVRCYLWHHQEIL